MQGRSPTFASPSRVPGGAAAWLRDGNVDTALIAAGTWTVDEQLAGRDQPRLPSRSPRTAVDSPRSHGRTRLGHAGRSLDLGWRVHARGRCNRRVGEPAGRRHLLGRPGVRRVGVGWNGAGADPQCRRHVGIRDLARVGFCAERECRLVRRRRRQLARLDPRVRRIAPVGDGGRRRARPRPRDRTAGP